MIVKKKSNQTDEGNGSRLENWNRGNKENTHQGNLEMRNLGKWTGTTDASINIRTRDGKEILRHWRYDRGNRFISQRKCYINANLKASPSQH